MTVWPLLLVIRALFALEESPATASPGSDVVIYVAARQGGGGSAAALSEAVATYTRDLRLTLQTVNSDKVEPSAATLERVTALVRTRRARLAFWCVPAPDGKTVVLHWLDARGVVRKEAVPLGEREGTDGHRAVALKLRAILTPESGRAGATSSERTADGRERDGEAARAQAGAGDVPGATSPAASSGGARAGAKPGERDTKTVSAAKPTADAAPPAAKPRAEADAPSIATPASPAPAQPSEISEWAVALGYAGSSFSGAAAMRHGLGVQVVRGLGNDGGGEVFAGVEVGRAVGRTVSAGSVSVHDVPVRVGARLTPVRGAVVLGVGAFGSVHLLAASATAPSGARDDRIVLAAGGGVEVVVRAPTMWPFAWELRAWGEGLAPRTRFRVGGAPAADTGLFAAGIAFGVLFPPR